MNMIKKLAMIGAVTSAVTMATGAYAGATPEEIAKLGNELTPSGAERAGNADGTIPEWTGGLTEAPAGWTPEQGYIDPFADEQPLFTITAENYQQYEDKLSTGMIEMMKKYPNSYKMPVYKTHRTFAYPQNVYDHMKVNAANTSLDGETLNNYTQPDPAFPIVKTGSQLIYNHLTRYYGGYKRCGDWLPVQPGGNYYRVGFCTETIQTTHMDKFKDNNDLFYFFGNYDAPATLVGTIYLVHDTVDRTQGLRRAWIYNAGQRRVRRAPDLAYDNIDDGTEGMRITDDWWGFNGAIDRYDWNIVGKKEMYIPYNAYKLSDPTLKYDDMIDEASLKSDLFRYELHRVWVLEATLKEGQSHVYAKRTFYIDEDSWMIALADAYDSRGNLWRTYNYPLMQIYDAGVMLHRVMLSHDLVSGTFIASQLDNERKLPNLRFNQTGRYADFQTSAIRRRGIK